MGILTFEIIRCSHFKRDFRRGLCRNGPLRLSGILFGVNGPGEIFAQTPRENDCKFNPTIYFRSDTDSDLRLLAPEGFYQLDKSKRASALQQEGPADAVLDTKPNVREHRTNETCRQQH